MNKNELMTKFNRSLNRAGLMLKKYSPEILVTVGVVGTVASTVLACKATTKISMITDETKDQIDKIHLAGEKGEINTANGIVPYTEEDLKKDTTIIYAQTAIKFAKLYGPAVAVGTLSIASILAGHNILRKRNVALAAAYTALETSFKDYRNKVVERFGAELDKELKYNLTAKTIEMTETDEKGKEKTVSSTVMTADEDTLAKYSPYAKFFDESCVGWEKDPEYNLMFVRRQQDYANEVLKAKGHFFLNEAYDLLGIDRTKAGNIVGWIYDENNSNGDGYIDFGIYDIYKEANRKFVNGIEKSILLDFNVDGPILDLI